MLQRCHHERWARVSPWCSHGAVQASCTRCDRHHHHRPVAYGHGCRGWEVRRRGSHQQQQCRQQQWVDTTSCSAHANQVRISWTIAGRGCDSAHASRSHSHLMASLDTFQRNFPRSSTYTCPLAIVSIRVHPLTPLTSHSLLPFSLVCLNVHDGLDTMWLWTNSSLLRVCGCLRSRCRERFSRGLKPWDF